MTCGAIRRQNLRWRNKIKNSLAGMDALESQHLKAGLHHIFLTPAATTALIYESLPRSRPANHRGLRGHILKEEACSVTTDSDWFRPERRFLQMKALSSRN